MKLMIGKLEELGAKIIELDTDGIYFVPPELKDEDALEAFRNAMREALPEGIEVEFDGEYKAMYSYKMKNYALLHYDGEMTIKGAALKSRGLARFQRSFLRELIRLRLEGREQGIPALKEEYATAIEGQKWPVTEFAKTSTLKDSPSTYAQKTSQKSRGRDAAYELALKSDRKYRAGDQLTFYVTGTKKSVSVHESARLASEWDPEQRDENVPYYLAKLDALYKKFYDQSS
jgi:DNA polymerase I